MSFVHLNVHSEYAIKDSTLKISDVISLAKKNNQEAVAITDPMNTFALIKFYTKAIERGVKPIIGAELYIEDNELSSGFFSLNAYCMNHNGYLNLSKMISKAYKENQVSVLGEFIPLIKKEWLEQLHNDLIFLASKKSDVGFWVLKEDKQKSLEKINYYTNLLGDRFYLEIMRTNHDDEDQVIKDFVEFSTQKKIPLVASNDVRFKSSNDYEAHEIRTCIHSSETLEDPTREKKYTSSQYFKSSKAMASLFSDLPGVIENTVYLSQRCNLDLTLGTYFLPEFPVPEGMSLSDYFILKSKEGLEERLQFLFGHLPDDEFNEKKLQYEKRLDYELSVINEMKFPGYFFIVADFIQWAKDNGIPVGPGRGSGAGSLVAYSLKITDLDPLQYDLLFERFLNPERVSMPDFDVDFCMDRRDEVINYVSQHYGQDQVSQIVTFGTMSAKSVVRDVGRVLGFNYGFVDSIAKLIPNELGIKLKDAIEHERPLNDRYKGEEDVRRVLDYALKLEGTVRNTGKHAGGVVISPSSIDEFCPVLCEPDGSSVVTQLDKNDVETAGLVKFDFLGLRTLTIIDNALKSINQSKSHNDPSYVDIRKINLQDESTFKLIKTGRTTGIFQLESHGMQKIIKDLQPDSFEDLIALVALFRPGPLESGMVKNFIDRKHGIEEISYPDPKYQHPLLQPILEPTYGVILYQEQVMKIAQVLAGYSLGEADLLRRAMGKKKPEEMAKQRSVFKDGAVKNGVDPVLAMKIFDLVEKFAGYGFNKSHSAAYALISYQAAWLKTHFPVEFMAAQISSDMDNTEKAVHMIKEAESMGINFLPPDINLGHEKFTPLSDQNAILYGLGMIKGLGGAALNSILFERHKNGLFLDFFDFVARVDVSKSVLTALIYSGAFDSLERDRSALIASIPLAIKNGKQQRKAQETNQFDLFAEEALITIPLVEGSMSEIEILDGERKVLGRYLSSHPSALLRKNYKDVVTISSMLPQSSDYIPRDVRFGKYICGVIEDFYSFETKGDNPKKIVMMVLSDETGDVDVKVLGGFAEESEILLSKGDLVMFCGSVSEDSYRNKWMFLLDRFWKIDKKTLTIIEH